MKLLNIILLSAAAVVTSADNNYIGLEAPRAHQLDEFYTFEQYLSHFNKSYKDQDEYVLRKELFNTNMQTILNHNRKVLVCIVLSCGLVCLIKLIEVATISLHFYNAYLSEAV